ncbi:MAG: ATPase [Spirochaetia bacterium]|nr:ATPase [Spirochaetia bacterium]
MKIAIPTSGGLLDSHFGHASSFTFVEVDEKTNVIQKQYEVAPPKHEPGVLPRFLSDEKVNVIITGGMGGQAQSLLEGYGVKVVLGVAPKKVDEIVKDYLAKTLAVGANACDH